MNPARKLQKMSAEQRASIIRYLVVGGTTFAIDLGLLVALKQGAGLNVYLAATASYWLSLVYNFVLNRSWTFGAKQNLKLHMALYTSLVVFNYVVSLVLIDLLGSAHIGYVAAKSIAVVLSMSWNYFAYKYIFTLQKRNRGAAVNIAATPELEI